MNLETIINIVDRTFSVFPAPKFLYNYITYNKQAISFESHYSTFTVIKHSTISNLKICYKSINRYRYCIFLINYKCFEIYIIINICLLNLRNYICNNNVFKK